MRSKVARYFAMQSSLGKPSKHCEDIINPQIYVNFYSI